MIVVAAVIVDKGRYLACRRRPERGGRWEFPGGKVEPGESQSSALVREIAEELGVTITVGDSIVEFEQVEPPLRLVTYRAELVGPRPTVSTDHDRLDWLETDELLGLEWAEADLATVRALSLK